MEAASVSTLNGSVTDALTVWMIQMNLIVVSRPICVQSQIINAPTCHLAILSRGCNFIAMELTCLNNLPCIYAVQCTTQFLLWMFHEVIVQCNTFFFLCFLLNFCFVAVIFFSFFMTFFCLLLYFKVLFFIVFRSTQLPLEIFSIMVHFGKISMCESVYYVTTVCVYSSDWVWCRWVLVWKSYLYPAVVSL